MAAVDETWPGVVEVGDVAPALSSSLSMWCGCLSTTTWVTWPHCRRRGCGGCVVVVDLGGPGIVVVDDLGGVAVVIDDLAGVVVVHDVLVWWQAGGRRRRCGVTWQWSWSQ